MARSMTGYGRATGIALGKSVIFEIRSVNGKGLDASVRVPRSYGEFESRIRTYIESKGVARGKIDIGLYITDTEDHQSAHISLDRGYAGEYIKALYTLRDEFGLKDDISTMTVAGNPNVFTSVTEEEDLDSLWDAILPIADSSLDSFIKSREKEGTRLTGDLLSKIDELEEMRKKLIERSALYVPEYRKRLEERLREVLGELSVQANEQRILTECAIFADKTAIDEELVRLETHIKVYKELLLTTNRPVGRDLDFRMQEINREINTSGSKCCDSESTALVCAMKGLAEKIREQIQNLE